MIGPGGRNVRSIQEATGVEVQVRWTARLLFAVAAAFSCSLFAMRQSLVQEATGVEVQVRCTAFRAGHERSLLAEDVPSSGLPGSSSLSAV